MGEKEEIDKLDEMTLKEYPYQVEIQASILADPANDPEEWAENIEMAIEDTLSDLPCTVDSAVLERNTEPQDNA